MIKVVAQFFVKENEINKFIESCKELVEMSRKEIGCIKYELFQDEQNPSILSMIEEWENKQFLDEHFKSKHFTTIIPKLETLLSKEIVVNIYNKLI